MIGDLFDSPWKLLIIALVIIVLFGSKKLPPCGAFARPVDAHPEEGSTGPLPID